MLNQLQAMIDEQQQRFNHLRTQGQSGDKTAAEIAVHVLDLINRLDSALHSVRMLEKMKAIEAKVVAPTPATQPDSALHMMEKVGGSFIRSLAATYYCADDNNRARLRRAFAHEFERYERMFQQNRRLAEAQL